MGAIKSPVPAKLFVAMIAGESVLFSQAVGVLVPKFGSPDLESGVIPFTHTEYYNSEMGEGLLRKWVSFERLISQEELPQIKLFTNKLEGEFANSPQHRRINLDPGYLTDPKLVLASTKDFAHRIYLGQGIYGEVTLHYDRQQGWQPYPWSYPDYRQAVSLEFFKRVRQVYLKQTRHGLDYL